MVFESVKTVISSATPARLLTKLQGMPSGTTPRVLYTATCRTPSRIWDLSPFLFADYPDTCGGRSIELPAARSERRYDTSVTITAITNTSIKTCIASGAR